MDVKTAQEARVSVGISVRFTNPDKMYLDNIYNLICPSTPEKIAKIKQLRDLVDQGNYAAYKTQKKELWAFCWSGLFNTEHGAPKNDGLLKHSGRVQIDIDLKDKPRVESEQLRDKLGRDPHIEVAFLSPSGRGVKAGMLIPVCRDDREHKQAFAAAENYVLDIYNIKIDPSCKDVRRLCFLSYDPQMIRNSEAVQLDTSKWSKKPEVREKAVLITMPKASTSLVKNEKRSLTLDDAQVQLEGYIGGYNDYDTWIKVGHALKEAFGDQGYTLWAQWSAKSEKWADKLEVNHQQKWQGFTPTSVNGAATLIHLATAGGWTSRINGQSAITKGNWHYTKNKQGEAVHVANMHNVLEYLNYKKVSIWYDSFLRKVITDLTREGRQWDDYLTLRLTEILQNKYPGMRRISKDIVDQAVTLYAHTNQRNCLTDWLESLQWDQIPRLDSWLIEYCGATENAFTREAGRCWLLAAVLRAFTPGSKFDHCLVLEGPQGIGKSTALSILSNGWFNELNKFDGKDAVEALESTWIVELCELDGMKKADIEGVKRFLTTQRDKYRPAYGRHVVDLPRSCVFAGTTNEDSYLRDPTGNRRFWPIKCSKIEIEKLRKDRDVLIAEAVVRYRNGEKLLMHQEASQQATVEQEQRYTGDAWDAPIAEYISTKQEVSMADIFENVLGFEQKGQWKRTDEIRIGRIFKTLGWGRERVQRDGKRRYIYKKI